MTYLCFIETTLTRTPVMELDAQTPAAARAEARVRLASHDSGVIAHIYRDDHRIGSVRRGEAAA